MLSDDERALEALREREARLRSIGVEQALADANVVCDLVFEGGLRRLRAAGDEPIRSMTPLEVEIRLRTPD